MEIETIPLEIIWNILQRVDYNTILVYCQTCKLAKEILETKAFWIQKLYHDIGYRSNIFIDLSLVPDQRYLQIFTENFGLARGSERFMTPKYMMRRAIQQGRIDIINYLLKLEFDDINLILEEYAILNDTNSINYYLSFCPNYDIVAYGALIGGHKDLFDSILSLEIEHDWNLLISGVLRSNNTELFSYVLLKSPNDTINWQQLLESVVILGYRRVFDYIRELFAEGDFDYVRLGYMAAASNDSDFFDYVRSLTIFTKEMWIQWMYGTIESGNIEMFDYVQNLGNSDWTYNWNELLFRSLRKDHRNLFNHIALMLPENHIIDWDGLICNAINSHNPYLIKYLLSIEPNNLIIDWSKLILYTMNLKCKILLSKVLELVPDGIILDCFDIKRRATNFLEQY
jgi:hypothetical protein